MKLARQFLSPLRPAIDRLQVRWLDFSPRERRLVMLALAALAALGLISLGEALAREHARLRDALPRAQARQHVVANAATEITQLISRPAPAEAADTESAAIAALSELAAARGLNLALEREADGEHPEQVRFEGLGEAQAALEWLAEAQAIHGVEPLDLALRTHDGPDTVRGRLRLRGS